MKSTYRFPSMCNYCAITAASNCVMIPSNFISCLCSAGRHIDLSVKYEYIQITEGVDVDLLWRLINVNSISCSFSWGKQNSVFHTGMLTRPGVSRPRPKASRPRPEIKAKVELNSYCAMAVPMTLVYQCTVSVIIPWYTVFGRILVTLTLALALNEAKTKVRNRRPRPRPENLASRPRPYNPVFTTEIPSKHFGILSEDYYTLRSLYSMSRPSVVCDVVHPTHRVELFGNIFAPSRTVCIKTLEKKIQRGSRWWCKLNAWRVWNIGVLPRDDMQARFMPSCSLRLLVCPSRSWILL